MLKAYFDESGIHGQSPVCVVAGFVMEDSRSEMLASTWKYKVLEPYRVPYFHAKELANRIGPFKGWGDAITERFLDNAVKRINEVMLDYQFPPVFIGAAVLSKDFLELPIDERRWLTGGSFVKSSSQSTLKWKGQGAPTKPYFLAFQQAVLDAAKYEFFRFASLLGESPDKERVVHYVFDRQDHYEATAKAVASAMRQMPFSVKGRIGDVVFASKLRALPLQVADLMAYESYNAILDRMNGAPISGHRTWHEFTRSVFVDKGVLSQLVAHCPLKEKSRFILPDPVPYYIQPGKRTITPSRS